MQLQCHLFHRVLLVLLEAQLHLGFLVDRVEILIVH